jgi:hypothetical protein
VNARVRSAVSSEDVACLRLRGAAVRQTFRSTNGIRAKTRKIFVLAICCELCVAQNELVGGFPRIVSEAVRPVLVCNGFGHHVPHVVKNCMTQEVARLYGDLHFCSVVN